VTGLIEVGVFAAFFDSAGFVASRAIGHGVCNQDFKQPAPKSVASLAVAMAAAMLRQGLAPLPKGIQRAFEAQAVEFRTLP